MPRIALISAAALAAILVPGAAGAAAPVETSAALTDTVRLELADAIDALTVADESRTGYSRDAFRHWVDEDRDGCNTRQEVLIDESVIVPTVGGSCRVESGQWLSYYDEQTVTVPGALDIDHMVPLAEAWDSGAGTWDKATRQAYANDLGFDRSLVAVTARTNRQKADQDPATWLPPAESATCQYLTDWVSVKTRWSLNVDEAEKTALLNTAEAGNCRTIVEVTPAR